MTTVPERAERDERHRSGFVSFVGRPNVGKSTLTNALVGEKVAITSPKPQTTRRAIRGVRTSEGGQLVIVDTPGIHRPRTLLGERLNDLVSGVLVDVDVIGFCVPADERIGPGDRFIAEQLRDYPRAKKVAIVTKADKAGRGRIAEALLAVQALGDEVLGGWDEIVPVAALAGEGARSPREQAQIDELAATLIGLLPEGPPLYGDETVTEETDEDRIAELIREAALEAAEEELPHSIAVTIDDIAPRSLSERSETKGPDERPMTDVYASLWVERDSQKGIVIGKGGQRLKAIGAAARPGIEALVGTRVFLSLHVKVAKDWQRDPKLLGRLGF